MKGPNQRARSVNVPGASRDTMNPPACRVWERLISRSCSEWQVSLEDTTPRQETSVLDPVRTEDGKLRLEFVCFRSALRHDFADASRPRETSASPTCESWCVTWSVRTGASVVNRQRHPRPKRWPFGLRRRGVSRRAGGTPPGPKHPSQPPRPRLLPGWPCRRRRSYFCVRCCCYSS